LRSRRASTLWFSDPLTRSKWLKLTDYRGRHAHNGASNFFAYPPHCDERPAGGDWHERELQVLQKTAIRDHPRQLPLFSLERCRHPITQDVAAITDLGATRHRLDLDLARDIWGARNMNGFLALYLIACLDPTNHNTCVSLPVTDSTQAQPDGSQMSMMGCLGIQGGNSAKKFWEDHPDMHKAYHFGGWSCQVGNKKAPDRGHA
jgi:hypothetical protein